MTKEDRSVEVGRDVDRSVIIPGNSNTATITNYYYYYREDTQVVPEPTDNNLPCPYRGLFHFSPNDADIFFGREVFVEELFTATQNHKLIPVLGASGSGKSSVVLAGLVPKLQNEGHWKFTHFRPGSEPFHALAEALVSLYEPDKNATEQMHQARQLAEYFVNGSVPLQDVFSQIERNYPNHRVLLIADQFEELYTLCREQKIRRSFLDILLTCFQSSPDNNTVLVATMRADFLGNVLSYRPFGDVLKNDIKLSSMTHDELSQVIVKPPEKLGVTFQDGLVKRILDDVDSEPGNLPLLEFALTELWKRRRGKQLTHAAYEEIGEVKGALARHADENYGKLSATEKEQVRRIFIQLVRPGEGTEDTRRLATKAELGESNWGLVKKLADARLVVTSRNAEEQETVEVVHEALIRNWGELRQWMETDRNFRIWQERLRSRIHQWEETQGDEGALLRGAALADAEEKLKQCQDDLAQGEEEFIQLSLELRDREVQHRQSQQQGIIIIRTVAICLSIGVIGLIILLNRQTLTIAFITANKQHSVGKNLEKFHMPKINLSQGNFSRANLSQANLKEADLSKANLQRANLHKTHMPKINLSQANLSQANLSQANLKEADLSKANLQNANLHKTHMPKINLSQANLSQANLEECDFSRAKLNSANFTNAYMPKVNLQNADLSQADFRGVNNLTSKQVKSALNWEKALYNKDFAKKLGLK